MAEAAGQNWGTRALERQIGTLYYERLLASRDRKPVRAEATRKTAKADLMPREFVRDPEVDKGLAFCRPAGAFFEKYHSLCTTHVIRVVHDTTGSARG